MLFTKLLFFFLVCSLHAEVLTIDAIVSQTLENHPETRRAWWQAQESAAAYQKKKSICYPRVSFEGQAVQGREYKFIQGPETTYTSLGGQLLLSFLLLDGGERRAELEAEYYQLSYMNWQANRDVQTVLSQALVLIYETQFMQEKKEALNTSLHDIETSLKVAKNLEATGLKGFLDIWTIESSLALLKVEVAQAEKEFTSKRARLASYMGLAVDSSFEIASLPMPASMTTPHLTELLRLAHESRADLQAMTAQLAEKRAKQTVADAAYKPKLSWRGRAGIKKYDEDDSSGYNYENALVLEFPLFTGFEHKWQREQAFADYKKMEAYVEKLENQIEIEVFDAIQNLHLAQETFKHTQDYYSFANKAYLSLLKKYRAGAVSIFDLQQLQTKLIDARVKLGEAKTRWYLATTQLAFVIGTLNQKESVCTP